MSNEELQAALICCEEKRRWQSDEIKRLLPLTIPAKPKPSREPYLMTEVARLRRHVARLQTLLKRRNIEKQFVAKISKKLEL